MTIDEGWRPFITVAAINVAIFLPCMLFRTWLEYRADRADALADESEETTDDAVSEPEAQENTTSV